MDDVDCPVCMNDKKTWHTAFCTSCKDNGIICHTCIHQWAISGNNPWKCTICKSPSSTMRNIPYIVYPYGTNAFPQSLLTVQLHMMGHLRGILMTILHISLLVFIVDFIYLFVYVSALITVGVIKQTVYSIERAI